MRRIALMILALMLGSLPAVADGARVIETKDGFSQLVAGRTLSTLGVRLQVAANGEISGRAFGRDVTGNWKWTDGYFCRNMTVGEQVFPLNCQQVVSDGDRVTFIADKGTGDQARLRIR